MEETIIELKAGRARGYAIDAGPFRVVFAVTGSGMLGCGVFNLEALEKLGYPAAKVTGGSTVEDLLEGAVKEANAKARARGVEAGMTGREALQRLCS